MNVFLLDRDPARAAAAHCDKHVCKMIVESAQIVSAACWRRDAPSADLPYATTHVHHAWVVAAEHRGTASWILALGRELCHQYSVRYGKTHATADVLKKLERLVERLRFKPGLGPIPQCVPDDCKAADPVDAYRAYYGRYKATQDWFRFAKGVNPPGWLARHMGGLAPSYMCWNCKCYTAANPCDRCGHYNPGRE